MKKVGYFVWRWENFMNRGQVRFLIISLVVILLAAVGRGLIINTDRADNNDPAIDPTPDPTATSTSEQRMENFKRVKIQPDGKKAWEIVASKARYSPEDHLVIVESPQFSFYTKEGEPLSLRSREARVLLTSDKNEDVTRVELSGDLEMQVNDFLIKTQEAVFEAEQNRISSSGAVQIDGPGVTVVGQGYSVDVTNKLLTLEAEVQTTLSRSESS
jgi:LPS export ABC transporter protein LptC